MSTAARVQAADAKVGKLEFIKPAKLSGYEAPGWEMFIPEIRAGKYSVQEIAVGGDAPKCFVRIYEWTGQRGSWVPYIAKVGQKCYPSESISEHLMTRVGQILGVRVASSRLMHYDGQIRFLSRYFTRREEVLVHGAEILSEYLQDKEFVEAVGDQKMENQILTFETIVSAIGFVFPQHSDRIVKGLVRMVGFDAIVGNQDRHIYNWGVLRDVRNSRSPRFSPIYDTARGLLWQHTESEMERFGTDHSVQAYVRKGEPGIRSDACAASGNHFAVVKEVASVGPQYKRLLAGAVNPNWTRHFGKDNMIFSKGVENGVVQEGLGRSSSFQFRVS